MNEYLQKGSKASSMRLAFVHSVFVAAYGGLLLSILDIILNKGVNLLGVAAVIGALAGTAYWGKKEQAKIEKGDVNE